jgi:hypothetical protein
MIDWDDVAFPARILCIINLSNAKPNSLLTFPGQSPSFAEQGLYLIIQSYNPINKEAERQRREAALDRHSKRKRKRPRHHISSSLITNDDDTNTIKRSIFEMYTLQVLPNTTPSLPTLYIVNVDSIVGPTIGVSDISRHYSAPSTTLEVTDPSRPTIFLTTRRQEWANNWTEYIDWKHRHLDEGSDESSEEEDEMPDNPPEDAPDNMSDNPPDL